MQGSTVIAFAIVTESTGSIRNAFKIRIASSAKEVSMYNAGGTVGRTIDGRNEHTSGGHVDILLDEADEEQLVPQAD